MCVTAIAHDAKGHDRRIAVHAPGLPLIERALVALLNDVIAWPSYGRTESTEAMASSAALRLYYGSSTHWWRSIESPGSSSEGFAILISRGWRESETAVRAAGLHGYLGPGCVEEHLRHAVGSVVTGGFYYRSGEEQLTVIGVLAPRQVEVLRLIGQGLADGEIAGRMKITERTVRYHLEELYRKLELERRGELASLAALGGLTFTAVR